MLTLGILPIHSRMLTNALVNPYLYHNGVRGRIDNLHGCSWCSELLLMRHKNDITDKLYRIHFVCYHRAYRYIKTPLQPPLALQPRQG
jgi:hypothetical protein